MTVKALNPRQWVRFKRMERPSIFDLRQEMGNAIGELNRLSKSKALVVYFHT